MLTHGERKTAFYLGLALGLLLCEIFDFWKGLE